MRSGDSDAEYGPDVSARTNRSGVVAIVSFSLSGHSLDVPASKRSESEPTSATEYLTCREATSDKFHVVVDQGCDMLTLYGRRGDAGVTSSKTFGTANDATSTQCTNLVCADGSESPVLLIP